MSHFELLEDKLIGEGSFGKVYHCRWHGSLAVAKQSNVVEADETVEMTQEIEMIENFRNDYIIQFFGTAHHNGKLCLITSYAEKGSLRCNLAKHALPEQLKPSVITGLIRGMYYLKSNNVVHRDLKSANVLLDPNFVPKICDFGLALLKLNSATRTKSSADMKTARWMAPELLQIMPSYSFASDVYALGVVIWEIFTEKLPYSDTADNEMVKDYIRNGEHENIPEDIPEHYKSIIKNCWHLYPHNRISVEEISRVNESILSRTGTAFENCFFDKDVTASVQAINIDSGHTPSQQKPTDFNFSVQDISKDQEITIYTKVLDQYLQDTNGISDSKDQLASALGILGDGFIQWIKTAANQGNNIATIVLGEMYYHGYRMPQDYRTASELFSMISMEATCDEGKSRVQFNLGRMYENGQGALQSDEKAVECYSKAAKQGHAMAQNDLGVMYRNGRGVPQSDEKAVEWYKKAAEQGNAMAQKNLALMYENGRGVPQSHENAVEWYTRAAEQGYAIAQIKLGWMYDEGRGVPQSYEKAVEWFTKAAEQGNMNAQFNLGWMYENGRGVPQSDDKAVEWYAKSAEQGNADAQCSLGLMYKHGRGVPQSDNKAVSWYTKAAKQGNAYAQNNMGNMYWIGRGVLQSDEKALELYTKAAEQGYDVAQNNLGLMYEEGKSVPQNLNKAVELYTKAAEQGNENAQYNLGLMYEKGRGVSKNYEKALGWYRKAAEQGSWRAQQKLGRMNQRKGSLLLKNLLQTGIRKKNEPC